jgi:hypothetical protein
MRTNKKHFLCRQNHLKEFQKSLTELVFVLSFELIDEISDFSPVVIVGEQSRQGKKCQNVPLCWTLCTWPMPRLGDCLPRRQQFLQHTTAGWDTQREIKALWKCRLLPNSQIEEVMPPWRKGKGENTHLFGIWNFPSLWIMEVTFRSFLK